MDKEVSANNKVVEVLLSIAVNVDSLVYLAGEGIANESIFSMIYKTTEFLL